LLHPSGWPLAAAKSISTDGYTALHNTPCLN
jgi:hypothetical protein